MSLFLIASALAGTPGEVDAGFYGGAFLPSAAHELYDPLVEHHPLSVAPNIGLRASYQPFSFLGFELDGNVGAADGEGLVLFSAGGLHLVGHLPDDGAANLWEPMVLVGGSWLGVSSSETALGNDLDYSFSWGPAIGRRIGDHFKLRADLRHYVTARHYLVPEVGQHVAFSVGLSRILHETDQDVDGDGIFGARDACPTGPETVNAYVDDDGCPDKLATVRLLLTAPDGAPAENVTVRIDGKEVGKTDSFGEVILPDRIPGETLGTIEYVPAKGTGMDVLTVTDARPIPKDDTVRRADLLWLPGVVRVVARSETGPIGGAVVAFRGGEELPEQDLGDDGDAFFTLPPGKWTLLVSAAAFGIERRLVEILPEQRSLALIQVQLFPATVKTTREEVVILEAVQFDFGKATIRPESEKLLTQVANNLLQYTEVKQVEIQGHTDDKGSDTYNKDLSQRRVEAVVQALTALGVAPERLAPVGYGEVCPIATNKTDGGRADNRRVQFIVRDPMPQDGIPCRDGKPARRASPTTVNRVVEEAPK